MKLPIKKKYFDEIAKGDKVYEYRDAHITFVCEETGEMLKQEVLGVKIMTKQQMRLKTGMQKKECNELFDNNFVIEFLLGDM